MPLLSDFYSRKLREDKDALGRLFGADYPTQEDINSFEACLDKHKLEICSRLPDSVYDHINTWGNALFILEEASERCPSSRNKGAISISQVYLLLAHYFVLLKESLYDPTLAAVNGVRSVSVASQKIRAMLGVKEMNMVKSSEGDGIYKEEVNVIRNVRNALAHSRISLKTEGCQVLRYRGAPLNHDYNQKSRPLVDVLLLGELMSSFVVSVVKLSGKVEEVHRQRESL